MGPKLFVGMDVHKDSVMLAVLPQEANEPTRCDRLPNDAARLRRYFRALGSQSPIQACYEASGAGFELWRNLRAWGVECDVIAPSLTPVRPGERRKHDRRDATQLARLLRAGELVAIRVPTEAEERIRDLVRCRGALQAEVVRSCHYVLKFLSRRGLVYREGEHWTRKHFAWLRRLRTGAELQGEDALTFGEYLALLEYKLQRREELDRQIEQLSRTSAYHAIVARLCAFRGIKTHAAMVLASEIGSWQRFDNPRQLMAFLGLVPSEHSSGERQRRGSITKAGNSRCRHVLVQAAWNYRNRPALGPELRRRQQGQPAHVIAHSWKAQQRLYKLFWRIAHRKPAQIAAVAAARELVGFLWAVIAELESAERDAA